MDRSTDQIERDLAQTRGDIDQTVAALHTSARTQVSRMRSRAMLAVGIGALGLLLINALRRIRR